MKPWEEISEVLSGEIKREIAQAYFSEKIALEKTWEEFLKDLKKELSKKEEALILNACRLTFMLKEEDLVKEFEKVTGFSLKSCYTPEVLESSNIKDKLFSSLKKIPFGFTSKSRFVKLFLELYENLYKAYKNYIETLKNFEEEYQVLKEETEKFHRKYDISSILGFFERLEGEDSSLTPPERRENIYESLEKKLRIKIPEAPSQIFELYKTPLEPKKIKFALIQLAKKAYAHHQNLAKELLKLASKES